jgi:hypothetical protein
MPLGISCGVLCRLEGIKMHYHCEIILPPTTEIERDVESVMRPFSENADPEESRGHGFWDWYQIGGRWSGSKVQARIDRVRLDEFYAELSRRKVTVSGLQWGKQELSPASQIPEIDALWREWFPESGIAHCPLFKHSGNTLLDDVCVFKNAPLELVCSRLIVGVPHWKEADKVEPGYMLECEYWNGCNHVKTTWDGTLKQALEKYAEHGAHYSDEYKAKREIKPDWLVVTVDYHS